MTKSMTQYYEQGYRYIGIYSKDTVKEMLTANCYCANFKVFSCSQKAWIGANNWCKKWYRVMVKTW